MLAHIDAPATYADPVVKVTSIEVDATVRAVGSLPTGFRTAIGARSMFAISSTGMAGSWRSRTIAAVDDDSERAAQQQQLIGVTLKGLRENEPEGVAPKELTARST